MGGQPHRHDIPSMFPTQLKPMWDRCLKERQALPTVFNCGGSRDENAVRFVIERLKKYGDRGSKQFLMEVADDPNFGRDAIAAAEAIEARLHGQPA